MPDKSKRELEREIDDLREEDRGDASILFIRRTPEGVFDIHREPVSETELDRAEITFRFTSPPESEAVER